MYLYRIAKMLSYNEVNYVHSNLIASGYGRNFHVGKLKICVIIIMCPNCVIIYCTLLQNKSSLLRITII